MDLVTSGILNTIFFKDVLTTYMMNATHGLEMATNNEGTIVGSSIRWPLTDIDSIAKRTSKGSPITPTPLMADTILANILDYEESTQLFPSDLAATNSAASLRDNAAKKVYHAIRNRYTQNVLDTLSQYDDTKMEIGSVTTEFDVELIDRINLLADNTGWGNNGKFMLLPPEAKFTLFQDQKFYEAWSLVNGKDVVDRALKGDDDSMDIAWTPYRGFVIGFMPKAGRNIVGLPVASDGSLMGYAWKKDRVGFGKNEDMTVNIFQDLKTEGNPIVFKSNGSCGSAIIDKEGVIGIKMNPNPA